MLGTHTTGFPALSCPVPHPWLVAVMFSCSGCTQTREQTPCWEGLQGTCPGLLSLPI